MSLQFRQISKRTPQMVKQEVSVTPTEYDQSSFAAITEITTMISENPKTDW